MRTIVALFLASAVAGCTVIPREEIAAFTDSYQEVDRSARAIYAALDARETAAAQGDATEVDRFGIEYISVLDNLVDATPGEDKLGLSARYAALDAMLAFNSGLSGLAEGRRFEAVKATLAPLSAVLGSAFGPYGAAASQAASLIIKGIEEAKTREDLLAALSQEITVTSELSNKTYSGNPVDVLLALLQDDIPDMQQIVRADATKRFTELSNAMGSNPDAAALAARADVVDDARDFMQTLADYQNVLGLARNYFAALRTAALDQSQILQTAQFVGLTVDMTVEARALIKNL